MQNKVLFLAIMAILLTACGPKPATDAAPPVTAESAVPSAETATPEAPANAMFSVDPASMSDCQAVVAKVKWDIRAEHPNVSDVEIYVGPDASPTLFAAAGSFGELDTGPWSGPGAIYRLRDKATGDELARVNVTGPADCSKKD